MSCNRKPRVRRKFFFPLLNLQDLCQELNLICSSLVSIPQATTACPFRGLRVRPRRNATASPQRLRICSVFVALKKSSSRDADLAACWLLMILVWLSAGSACSFGIETQSEEDYEARLVGS